MSLSGFFLVFSCNVCIYIARVGEGLLSWVVSLLMLMPTILREIELEEITKLVV